MPRFFVVFENAIGLSIFDCKGLNEVVVSSQQYQKQFIQFNLFSKLVHLEAFQPFPSTEVALNTQTLLTEGSLSDFYRTFLATNVPHISEKYSGALLGISEKGLAGTISTELGYSCVSNDNVREIIRGIREHFTKFMDTIKTEDVNQAQLGLAHGYSRAKVKFNQHGDDNMIISSVVLLTTLDTDLNTFAMRLREWYSVYFPELSALIPDHATYAAAVQVVGDKTNVNVEALKELLKDDDLVDKIQHASVNSIGREVSEKDLATIISMAERVAGLANYRNTLQNYLHERMHNIAPNLTELVSDRIGAQLIAKAGSLTNLSKAAASTVQLLGAEKALFNALKKRKDTPKYGIIFNSSIVGAADTKIKGRAARSLANKISIAARIDAFSDDLRGGHLGRLMKDMLEVRAEKVNTGKKPQPNFDAMVEAVKKARKLEASDPANQGAVADIEVRSKPLTEADKETDFFADGAERPAAEKPAGEEKKRRHRKHHHSEETAEQKEEEKPAEPVKEEPKEEEGKKKRRKHRSEEPKEEEKPAEPVKEEPKEEVEQVEEGKKKRRKHRKTE